MIRARAASGDASNIVLRDPDGYNNGGTTIWTNGRLPADAQPGDVLSVTIERDLAATEALREETKTLQDDLSQRDPGGDLEL